MPSLHIRIRGPDVGIRRRSDRIRQRVVPHEEREVCICSLVAYQPLFAGKAVVQDTEDACYLCVVALDGGLDFWAGLEEVEPGWKERRQMWFWQMGGEGE